MQKTVTIQTVEVELYDRRLEEVVYQIHNLIKGLQYPEKIYINNTEYKYISNTILKEKTVTYMMDVIEFCQKAKIKGEYEYE